MERPPDAPARASRLDAEGKSYTRQAERMADLLANPDILKPPEALVERFAYRGRQTVLAAREKQGKSTLLSIATAAVSGGCDFFTGASVPRGLVLYVNLEEAPGDLLRRLVHVGADPHHVDVLGARHIRRGADDLALEVSAAATDRVVYDLILIDSLRALAQRSGITESGAPMPWRSFMDRLLGLVRDTPAAMMIAHHMNKASDHYADSAEIGGVPDVLIEMSKPAAAGGRTRRFAAITRLAEIPDFDLTLDADGIRYQVTDRVADVEADVSDARVVELVRNAPLQYTQTSAAVALGGNAEKTRNAVRRVIAANKVKVEKHRLYCGTEPPQ